jgi:hypothetical protein
MSTRFMYYAAAAGALGAALVGCGSSGGSFANKPRPASPVNLTVYINNSHVSVSPAAVGAGPVVFIVTNQARQTESLMISSALNGGGATPLASTGPINPQATATVTVDFRDPGDYTVNTSTGGQTQAQQAAPRSIQPATLHVGSARPNGSNELLQP